MRVWVWLLLGARWEMLEEETWGGKCLAAPGATAWGWEEKGAKEGAGSREGMLHISRDEAGLCPSQTQPQAHVNQMAKHDGEIPPHPGRSHNNPSPVFQQSRIAPRPAETHQHIR